MAIYSFLDELPEARTTEYDGKVSTHERTFVVRTSNRYLGSANAVLVVMQYWPVYIGSPHPEDFWSRCRRMRAREVAAREGYEWHVQCSYSSEREIEENPLDDPPNYDWETEQYQEAVFKDEEDKGVLNSAGDPYDPPGQKDMSRRAVTIERNLAFVPTWIMNYEDAVNSDAITLDGISVAVGHAKCQRVSVSRWNTRNEISYRTVRILIHLSKKDWNFRPLDIGFRRKFGTKRIPIRYWYDPDANGGAGDTILLDPNHSKWKEGVEPTAPVLLDGSGQPLEDPTIDNAVFRNHVIYERLPFSALPI